MECMEVFFYYFLILLFIKIDDFLEKVSQKFPFFQNKTRYFYLVKFKIGSGRGTRTPNISGMNRTI